MASAAFPTPIPASGTAPSPRVGSKKPSSSSTNGAKAPVAAAAAPTEEKAEFRRRALSDMSYTCRSPYLTSSTTIPRLTTPGAVAPLATSVTRYSSYGYPSYFSSLPPYATTPFPSYGTVTPLAYQPNTVTVRRLSEPAPTTVSANASSTIYNPFAPYVAGTITKPLLPTTYIWHDGTVSSVPPEPSVSYIYHNGPGTVTSSSVFPTMVSGPTVVNESVLTTVPPPMPMPLVTSSISTPRLGLPSTPRTTTSITRLASTPAIGTTVATTSGDEVIEFEDREVVEMKEMWVKAQVPETRIEKVPVIRSRVMPTPLPTTSTPVAGRSASPGKEVRSPVPQYITAGSDARPGTPSSTSAGISRVGLVLAFVRTSGLVVKKVISGSPADRAGIQVGDVVESVNGWAIKSHLDFQNAVRKRKTITIQLYSPKAAGYVTKHLRLLD